MDASEVQHLRTAAERAFTAGRHQQALGLSIRLERAQPEEPAWPRYTALVCQAMGRTLDQLDALDRAAERHTRRGEILKAAAVCKHILALDPDHTPTRRRLATLRDAHARSGRGPPAPRTAPVRLGSGAFRRDVGAGLQGLALREVVPGARPGRVGDPRSGVHAIPLEASPQTSIDSLLGEESSAEHLASGLAAPQVMISARPSAPRGPPSSIEDIAVMAVAEELRAAQRTEQALIDTPLFRDMPKAAFHDLIDRAVLTRVARDEDVFRQGAPGDALFVIAEGEVGVIDEGPPRKGICKLGEGDFFGEMALLSDEPRSATCTALTDVELIVIDRATLKGVLRAHPEVLTVLLRFFRDRSIDRVLQTSPLFSGLTPRDQAVVRPYFRFLEVEPGAHLIEEDARPEGVLVLLAGKAEAVRGARAGRPERLGVLFPGDLVGEMSLLRGQNASATVRAIDKVLAVEFPAAAFARILEARPEVRRYVERIIRNRGPSFSEGGP